MRGQLELVGDADRRTRLGHLVQNSSHKLPKEFVAFGNYFGEQNSLPERFESGNFQTFNVNE